MSKSQFGVQFWEQISTPWLLAPSWRNDWNEQESSAKYHISGFENSNP